MSFGSEGPAAHFGSVDGDNPGSAGPWPGFGAGTTDVAATSGDGVSGLAARVDHFHKGVHSVNGQFGDVTVPAGPAIGGAPPAIAAASSAGVAATVSASDHTHAGTSSVNGATGAATIAAADAGLQIKGTAPALTVGQVIAAEWPLSIATRRVYLVDGVNGNDANTGFLDGGAAVFPISGATIAATALKTTEALAAIFPRVGNDRACEIIIAAGTYTGSLAVLLTSATGYMEKSPIVRGTATSATASCTAFDGSTNDNTFLGAVTVTGMNAAGYHPTGVPTAQVIPCLTLGGADPAFPAEPAAPLGWRIRFDAASTTAALRNVCRMVSIVAEGGGVGTLTTATALPAVPVAGDTFYLEQAGLNIPGGNIVACGHSGGTTGSFRGVQIAGVRATTAVTQLGAAICWTFSGWGATGNAVDGGSCACDSTFLSADRGTITAGGGLVITGSFFSVIAALFLRKIIVTLGVGIELPLMANFKEFVTGSGIQVTGAVATDSTSVFSIGSENQAGTNQLPSRVLSSTTANSGLLLVNSKVVLGQIDFTGMGAHSAVTLNESEAFQHPATNGTALTGSTGNTSVGMTLIGASKYIKNTSIQHNTVTGTTGDVLVGAATTIVVSWAALETTGLVTSTGDNLVGPSAPVTAVAKFSGGLLGGAGATTSYMADTGAAPAANLTAIDYPTSLRLVTRLRVKPEANTFATTVTAVLYQNGAPSAMGVNIPAGSTVVASDLAHPILFADGDTFALVLANAGDAAKTLFATAVLEGPI